MSRFCNIFIAYAFLFAGMLFCTSPMVARVNTVIPLKKEYFQKTQKLQIPFIANNGQADERVAFYANIFGGAVFVTNEGEIVYSRQSIALKETLVGGNVKGIKGEEKSETKVNYFKGNNPSKWKSNIDTYSTVSLGEVYKGIELKLKAYGHNVEKHFYVKPGSDPEIIQLKLGGAKSLHVNEEGQLEAETTLGTIRFTRPVSWQEIDGNKIEIDVKYHIQNSGGRTQTTERRGQNIREYTYSPLKIGARGVLNFQTHNPATPQLIYGFEVADYDKTKELIIDPLLASTFLGGVGDDHAVSPVQGSDGNIYVVGSTSSLDFPAITGSSPNILYDDSIIGNSYRGSHDVFVAKVNGDLTSLLASTFIGGTSHDYGNLLTIDSDGNVYVAGYTNSSDFPITTDVYGTSYNGDGDVFVAKLSEDLASLMASTFLGGSQADSSFYLSLDSSGNIYVTGQTLSSDFPTSLDAYDVSHNDLPDQYYGDGFISKLSGDLTSLLASTFLGGSQADYAERPVIDSYGNIYITGETASEDFPATTDAFDTSFEGPSDGFISKLSGDLTSLLASTFLGGSESDTVWDIALDTDSNIYISGLTSSMDFPTTTDAYNTSFSGYYDIIVSKLSGDLTNLLASTFCGGAEEDYFQSQTIDSVGNIYICGWTMSRDFPTTTDAFDTVLNGPIDGFVLGLNGDLTNLLASTFLGGSESDYVSCLAFDTDGNIYVSGSTLSSDFPTTMNAYDTSFSGGYDAFVAKFDSGLSASGAITPTPVSTLTPVPSPPSTQVATGKIYGFVINTRGIPIEFARVQLRATGKAETQRTLSDRDGFFQFEDLKEGDYVVGARKAGYLITRYKLSLEGGEEKEIEIVLKEVRGQNR